MLYFFLSSLSVTCVIEVLRLYRPSECTQYAELLALAVRILRRPIALHMAFIFFEPKLGEKKRLILLYLPVLLVYVPALIFFPGEMIASAEKYRYIEWLPLIYSLVAGMLFVMRAFTTSDRSKRITFLYAAFTVGMLIMTDVMTIFGVLSVNRWIHVFDVVPTLFVISLMMLYLQTPLKARAQGYAVAAKSDAFSIALCFSLSFLYFSYAFFGFGYYYFALKEPLNVAFRLPLLMMSASFILACINNSAISMEKKEWISGMICALAAPVALRISPQPDVILILAFSMFQLLFFIFYKNPVPLWMIGTVTVISVLWSIFSQNYPMTVLIKMGDLLSVLVVFLCAFFFILFFNSRYDKHVRMEKKRLALQDSVIGMAVSYTNIHGNDLEKNISSLLETASQLPGVDRALLWLALPSHDGLHLVHEWHREDLEPSKGVLPSIYIDKTKRFYNALLANEVIEVFSENYQELFRDVSYNPYERTHSASVLSVPLMADTGSVQILSELGGSQAMEGYDVYDDSWEMKRGETSMAGILSLHSRQMGFKWSESHRHLLHMLASAILHVCVKAQSERSLHVVAYHDHLTRLPNRYHLKRELKARLKERKEKGGLFAVALIDLDSFKYINDTAGHATGDEVLRQVASRLVALLYPDDMAFRFGGDEFVLIFNHLKSPLDIQERITRSLQALEEPVTCGGQSFFVTASAGVAIAPEDGETQDTLLKHADMTMYTAKQAGKNCFAICTPEIKQAMIEEGMLINHLNYAIEKGQLYLCYQPVIRLSDGKIVAFEALCRWNLPGVGNISPARFIPLAEQSFYINRIGEFVLSTAVQEFKQWLDEGLCEGQICVNFSMQQFQDVQLSTIIGDVLQSSGLSPTNLVMEITESVEGSQTIRIENTLQQLHEKGVSVAMDDFGTRFSSFNRIKNLPLQSVKIDMQFIRGMVDCEKDRGVIKAMIALSKSLDMTLVAEGVETREQLDLLRSWGCDRAQGYYISKPLPKEAVRSFIRDYPQGLGTIFQ